VCDKQVKSRTWIMNFKVLDFEANRNDAKDAWGSYTCYSDGSRLADHTGYGYVIHHHNKTIHEGLDYMGPKATVFQAEIRAISTIAIVLRQLNNQKITIKTDSQAAISAISSTTINSKTVAECRNLLNKLGAHNSVSIAWVKAHVGNEGNEQADRLAKLGTAQKIGPARFRYYESGNSFTQQLSDRINRLWQQRWDNQPPEKYIHSKVFIQSIEATKYKFNYILKQNSRAFVGKLTQVLTGHCNLNYSLNKSNHSIDPECRKCHKGPETPAHLIQECETLANHRRDTFDGFDILTPAFDWTIHQITRLLQATDLWCMLDHLQQGQ
jgi:ribonuclease HI